MRFLRRFFFLFIGNGKPKQSTSRCAVEISEIVNRIAPQVIVTFYALYMQSSNRIVLRYSVLVYLQYSILVTVVSNMVKMVCAED